MPAAALTARPAADRATSARLALGAVGACAVLAAVDPDDAGPFPLCPTQALLGIDCPACGTLRGLHALSRGRFVEALDHNVLLLVAVPLAALVWLSWVGSALGRSRRPVLVPRGLVACAVVALAAFAVLRNVPVGPLGWLDSRA